MAVEWGDRKKKLYRFSEHKMPWKVRILLGAVLTVLVLAINHQFDSDRVVNPPAAPAVTQPHQP